MNRQPSPQTLIDELKGALRTGRFGRDAYLFDRSGSTQDITRELAVGGAPEGTLVWTMEQIGGRGRLGRTWAAGPWGLWFSLLLRPPLPAARAPFLSIVTGVGIARAMNAQLEAPLRIKWPNDLRRDGLKVGGILVEAAVAGANLEYVAVGVGINLVPPTGGWGELSGVAGSAWAVNEAPRPAAVLATILSRLELEYDGFIANGPGPTRSEWLRLSETIGQEVTAQLEGGTVVGTAVDLDDYGELIVRCEDGTMERVGSGEVVHLHPYRGTFEGK
ncbi:MAG: biotin--[acetyl-CoA-carboxylase] ligase [Candidatus Dormibacteria bacterium]